MYSLKRVGIFLQDFQGDSRMINEQLFSEIELACWTKVSGDKSV